MADGKEQFKSGMRHLAGGVTLITTLHEGVRGGLTATAVCSVSVDPPQLLVCVNKEASAHDAIGASGIFCVNVLKHAHTALALRFSGQDGIDGDARFADRRWDRMITGAPVLPDALVNFDCRIGALLDAGSHTVYVGKVVAVTLSDGTPLIYWGGKFVAPQAISP